VELRSSDELLGWLSEVSASPYNGRSCAASISSHSRSTRGRSRGRRPPNDLADRLYELRDRGAIRFDDSDARPEPDPGARKDIFAIRQIGVRPPARRPWRYYRARFPPRSG